MLPFLEKSPPKPPIIEERDADGNRTDLRLADQGEHVEIAQTLMDAFKAKDIQSVAAILKRILGS